MVIRHSLNVTDVTLSARVPIMVSGSIWLDGGTGEQQSAIVVKVISSCTYSSQIDPPAEARAALRSRRPRPEEETASAALSS